MSYVTISKASEILGTSHTTIRRKLKKHYKQLAPLIKQENGVVKLSEQALNFINGKIRRTDTEDINTDEQKVTPVNNCSSDITDFFKDQIREKDSIIKMLLQESAEKDKQTAEKDRRHDVLIQQLTGQIQQQSQQLEDLRQVKSVPSKKRSTPKFKLVKKEPADHTKNWGIFKKMYISFFYPEKLRKSA